MRTFYICRICLLIDAMRSDRIFMGNNMNSIVWFTVNQGKVFMLIMRSSQNLREKLVIYVLFFFQKVAENNRC